MISKQSSTNCATETAQLSGLNHSYKHKARQGTYIIPVVRCACEGVELVPDVYFAVSVETSWNLEAPQLLKHNYTYRMKRLQNVCITAR